MPNCHYAFIKILKSQHFSLCIHQDSQLLASHYALIRILSSWYFSLCFHQDSQLLALLLMHSSGFSTPGTSYYAFIRILSCWRLCTHQDSQLLALFIMHRFGYCTGTFARLCSSSTPHIRSMIGFHLSLSAHGHPAASRDAVRHSGPSNRLRQISCVGQEGEGSKIWFAL